MFVNTFRFWCQSVLPTIYTDALSYYEVLCAMTEKLNEVIDNLNTETQQILDSAAKYTDNAVKNLDTELSNKLADLNISLSAKITETINDTAEALKTLKELVDSNKSLTDSELQKLQNKHNDDINRLTMGQSEILMSFNELYQWSMEQRESLNDEFIYYVEQLEKYVQDSVAMVERLYVINPITKKYEPIQKVIDSMYNALQYNSLTAKEYDSMGLTVKEYNAMNISAWEYDTKARFIFWKRLYNTMRSPFTGQMDTYDNIIMRLVDFHKNPLTAEEYQNLQLTAEEYAEKNITAYEYDFKGKEILTNG